MQRVGPLWRKAPLGLLRFPGIAAALTGAGILLALTAAAMPLFLSAAASDVLAQETARPGLGSYVAGIQYRNEPLPLDARAPGSTDLLVDRMDSVFRKEAAASPGLGAAVEGIMGDVVQVRDATGRPTELRSARLFAGTDAASHVEVLAGSSEAGALFPDLIADALELRPGDMAIVQAEPGHIATVPVGGVYRGLYASATPSYWQLWDHEIRTTCTDCAPLPQFILLPREEMLEIERRLGHRTASFRWQAPLAGSMTLPQADRQLAFARRFEAMIGDRDTELGRALPCCHEIRSGFRRDTAFDTELPQILDATRDRIAALDAPGRILRFAGLLVAVLIVAATGVFSFGARRPEMGLLRARGISPVMVGVRGAVETLAPVVVGGLLGVIAAVGLVLLIGPSAPIATDAWGPAARAAAAAVVAGVVLVGIITGVAYLRLEVRRRRLRWGPWLVWEVPAVAFGLVGLERIRSTGALAGTAGEVRRPSVLMLVVPILLLAGVLGVSARLLRSVAVALRRRSAGLRPAPYLAVHRLAAAPALTAALFAGSGLCLGVFVEAQTLVGSLRTTVEAKSKLFVGSDVRGSIDVLTPPVPESSVPITRVTRVPLAGTVGGSNLEFDLLAIDPGTFEAAAYWRPSFSPQPLEELVGGLRSPPGNGLAALVVGTSIAVPSIVLDGMAVPVREVGTATAFPGSASLRPLIVVDGAALVATDNDSILRAARATTELWASGSVPAVERAFAALPFPPREVLTADQVLDVPALDAAINTFLALNVLGLAAALLVVGALLMYLQARERSQLVAYGLSMRMGMTDRSHRRSLALEGVSLLGSAFLVAAGVAVAVAVTTLPLLDPLTDVRPGTVVVLPATNLAVTFVALIVAGASGAWLANLRARRVPLGEVLRDA